MNKKFPIFLDLSDKEIMVIGGGRIATRRIRVLTEFSDHLFVIAPLVTEELEILAKEGQIQLIKEEYHRDRILGADMVLACTDNEQVNDTVYRDCKVLGIMVNVSSDKRKCDFYFPGIVTKDHLVVGVTASGEDHKKARKIRESIAELLVRECP